MAIHAQSERSTSSSAMRGKASGHATQQASFIVGAAIGTGMIAKAAEAGGADFLVALNAGRIRMMGAASIACHLAIHDANRFVMDFARAEILDRVAIPVFFGASVFDPKLDVEALLDRIEHAGFSGVTNFPSAIHLNRRLRDALARHGLGYTRELDLIGAASRRGLSTIGYAGDTDQSVAMVSAGAEIICYNFGWNVGGWNSLSSSLSLAQAAESAERVFARLRRERRDVVCVVEGGPIESAEDAAEVCRLSRADGYIGGSTIDRLPLENAVSEAAFSYKSIADLNHRIETLQDQMMGDGRRLGLIGRSPGVLKAVDLIKRFADLELSVLVSGPNGTGKELVAQALHRLSRRNTGPMVEVNCAALPHDLLESELFGYEKGAFTGADRTRLGRFEEASGGTLFLDEIGEMDPRIQAKLLRVLESGSFQRLGSNISRQTSARIVCATNRDLKTMVAENRFREDLYYRLNRMEIDLPSLAERIEDLPLLVEHFVHTAVAKINPHVRFVDGEALRTLMAHSWPGNVRELRNVLERAAILCDGDRIHAADLPRLEQGPSAVADGAPDAGLDASRADPVPRSIESERDWILEGLRRNRFRRGETAQWLGISRKSLYRKMKDYGLS